MSWLRYGSIAVIGALLATGPAFTQGSNCSNSLGNNSGSVTNNCPTYNLAPSPAPWRGWLQPANEPTPPNACDDVKDIPKDAPILIAGQSGNVLPAQSGTMNVIMLGSCNSLSLSRTGDGLEVSAEIYDEYEQQLGDIKNGGYKLDNSPNLVVEHSGDLSTLVVHDIRGSKLMIYVKYVNIHAIKVRGRFFCPSVPGDSVLISDDDFIVNGPVIKDVHFGSCFSNRGGSISIDHSAR